MAKGGATMSDLISREALMKRMNRRLDDLRTEYGRFDHYTDGFDDALFMVEHFQSVDVEPVRHGCWFPYRVAGEPLLRFQCSACHHWVDGGTDRNFCPNCGAKMGDTE